MKDVDSRNMHNMCIVFFIMVSLFKKSVSRIFLLYTTDVVIIQKTMYQFFKKKQMIAMLMCMVMGIVTIIAIPTKRS